MQCGPLHLRIARTAVPVPSDRIAFSRKNGRKAKAPFSWAVEISGITVSHIAALALLVPVTASAAGALLALILVGLHLCPTSLAIDLFCACGLGGLSSGLISLVRGNRSRRWQFLAVACYRALIPHVATLTVCRILCSLRKPRGFVIEVWILLVQP